MKRLLHSLLVSTVILLAIPGDAQERRISTSAQSASWPAVDILSGGGSVFVWSFPADNNIDETVFIRRFDSTGTPIDPTEVAIASDTSFFPDIASSGTGEFIVVWNRRSGFNDIVARRFDDSGTAQGPLFELATEFGNFVRHPAVAMRPDGSFLATWVGFDGSGDGIRGRFFDASNMPISDDFLVNAMTGGGQSAPALAFDSSGRATVAWASDKIYMRRFDSSGTALTPGDVEVSGPLGDLTFAPFTPAVATRTDGSFLIVWADQTDEPRHSVRGRFFQSTGDAVGSEIVISEDTAWRKSFPAVASTPTGEFEVVWQSYEQAPDALGYGIFTRRVSSVGAPLGGESLVNVTLLNSQRHPDIVVPPTGDPIITWDAPVGPPFPPETGILGNFPLLPEVFADDFEGGTLSSWSLVIP